MNRLVFLSKTRLRALRQFWRRELLKEEGVGSSHLRHAKEKKFHLYFTRIISFFSSVGDSNGGDHVRGPSSSPNTLREEHGSCEERV